MKISEQKLKSIIQEEVRKVINEFDVSSLPSSKSPRSSYRHKVASDNLEESSDNNLRSVSSFLADWGRNKENFRNWGVAHVGDKVEINTESPEFDGRVKAVIEPMGAVSGVYHIKSNNKAFAEKLFNVIENNISDENLPYIKNPS